MEATRVRQSVQLGQEGDQATDGCPATCSDSGEMGGPPEDQQVTAAGQRCNQATEKNLRITTPPEGKGHRSFLNPERLRAAKAMVDKAVKNHKIFSVQGPYPVVREALRARGWVERRMPRLTQHVHRRRGDENGEGTDSNDADDSDDDDCELGENNPDDADKEDDLDGMYDLMSRLVRNEMVYFYWTNRRETVETRTLQKEQIANHFVRAGSFTTKVGLCVNLRNLRWFDSADPDTFFPRCYRLGAEDEKHAFIEDYRRTACTSLLQCIVERKQSVQGEGQSCHKNQSNQNQRKRNKQRAIPLVPSKMIDIALKVCQEFLDSLEHSDIDIGLETPHTLTKEQWAEFINNYYLVVHVGAEIEDRARFVDQCQAMLQRMREVSPQLDTDGIHNIWIIKPGAKSRGRGITCAKRLDEILRMVDSDPALIKDSKWVVQKYVERPLLVHGTKFDVRQWFLVTDWNPLTVWFYAKCYLRFSTQPYSLDTLDSSVHLCNNSIQKHLQPSQQRHQGIPADNMWSCDQFRAFLSSQGRAAQWGTVVVPGMKKAVIHALQTAQDLVESRKNTFELYGADFILGHDLRPWLIEINVSPTMAPSTSVTARLCTAVQEDTLRVVLDRRLDRTANTGGFRLIYKQAAVKVPQYVGVKLLVEGSQIKRPRPLPPPRTSNPPAAWHVPPSTRHCAPIKENKSVAEKTKPRPKKWFKKVVSQLSYTKSDAQSPGSLPPEQHLPVATETLRFHLSKNVISSFHLPVDAQSRSMFCWRRPQVLKKSQNVQHCIPKKHHGPYLPLEVISLNDPDKEPLTLEPTAGVLHPKFRVRNISQHQGLHQSY